MTDVCNNLIFNLIHALVQMKMETFQISVIQLT